MTSASGHPGTAETRKAAESTGASGIFRTVDAFFERFGAEDLPGLLGLFADTVDFDVPGSPDVPWTGARSGRDEIAEFFTVPGTVQGAGVVP
ncbi:nuclear transport factor 2 family protein [Streptomyces bikiniensis]|uniref:nuclear transport factor 2 family protein n=1 Tax=Streptomyces bikiniensis TaxID=1896 RepID=UPI00052709A8|nr:nuclear transport factor 2 family protein [Streptomyces bikiniensis]